jgi:hypothetical protein
MMKWMSFSSEEARDIGMRIQTKCTIWALLQFARTQIHSQEKFRQDQNWTHRERVIGVMILIAHVFA